MAEITRKRTGELLRRLFEILLQVPEGMPAGKALEALAASVTLTPYEAGIYESSGTRRFEKIVRFATVDCVKAGWLAKHKGLWTVTDTGIQAYQAFKEPEVFYREAVKLYHAWKASQVGATSAEQLKVRGEPEIGADGDAPAEKSADVTFEQAEEQAWGEIEQFLLGMDPYDFQHLVADLLKAMGYYVSWVSPPREGWRDRYRRQRRPTWDQTASYQGAG